ESGIADLADGPAYDRLAAERQQQFVRAHPRGRARGKDDGVDAGHAFSLTGSRRPDAATTRRDAATPRRDPATTRRDAPKTRRTRRSGCTRWSSCLRVFVADPHAADPAVDVRVVQCAPFSANCSAPRRGPHLGRGAQEAGGEAVIPAAFEYLRASSVDEAVA